MAKSKKKPAKSKARRPRVKAKRPPQGGGRPTDTPREIAVFDPEGVERVLDVMPPDELLQAGADRLQGLAHPSRLKAVIALGTSELCVGDVAALVGLSLSATSTMLKQLRSLGFLATRSVGKQTYYRLADPSVNRILELTLTAGE